MTISAPRILVQVLFLWPRAFPFFLFFFHPGHRAAGVSWDLRLMISQYLPLPSNCPHMKGISLVALHFKAIEFGVVDGAGSIIWRLVLKILHARHLEVNSKKCDELTV